MLETGVHVRHLPGVEFVLMGSTEHDTISNVHVNRYRMSEHAQHACINYMLLLPGGSDDLIAPGAKHL